MQKNKTYELAMWRAKENPSRNRDQIVNLANAGLASFPGLAGRTIYQSLNDPKWLFDWVEWDTLEQAEAAAKDMMSVPALQDFVQLIERTEVFEHYQLAEVHNLHDSSEGIVELVAYTLKPDADVAHFFSAYSQAVAGLDGYQKRYLFRNAKGSNNWTELAFWESEEKARAAVKRMEKDPALGQAMEMVADIQMLHQYFHIFE